PSIIINIPLPAEITQRRVIQLTHRVITFWIRRGHLTKFIQIIDNPAVHDPFSTGISSVIRIRILDQHTRGGTPLLIDIVKNTFLRIIATRSNEFLTRTHDTTVALVTGLVQKSKD